MTWEIYRIIAVFVGVIAGVGIWIYSLFTWGFLLGLMFGWIPAAIGGLIIGFLWPLLIVAVVGILLLVLANS